MTNTRTPLLATSASSISSSSTTLSSPSRRAQIRKRNVTKYIAFASAILSALCAGSITAYSLYGHLFQERLHYTQLQVNYVIIAAELALYLPVSGLGYWCDRVGPAPLSFLSSVLFSLGYLLAAFTYRSGEKDVHGYTIARGWPLSVMVFAFVLIGLGTVSMYLSSVTTCAKNFGRGKYRGLALASPIAAFGLSGMWQSQLGARVLYERRPNGKRGDVDVFKYFLFLAFTLLAVGLVGTVFLKIVDEEELIDDAVEELERSGLLEDSEYFRRESYGSFESGSDEDLAETRRIENAKNHEDEEARKKAWLLNAETSRFLKDQTMWWLAAGFFFVSGPGEAFITNLGTIIGTLYPPTTPIGTIPTSPATHVSIVAITSTVARLLFGTLTDLLAPPSPTPGNQSLSNSLSSLPPRSTNRFTVSRVTFLILTALLLSFGQVLLASGLIQNHGERLWAVSTLIGIGYGAIFSLTPLIITVIWGVENFGTNWGIVAMVPALGATVWGVVYSNVYQWAAARGSIKRGLVGKDADVLCYGKECYSLTFWAMATSVWVGCAFWVWAWKGKGGWSRRGISV